MRPFSFQEADIASEARISADKKFKDMQERQQVALKEEQVALEATRAKTARLRELRLAKEVDDKAKADAAKAAKPAPRRRVARTAT